MINVMVDGQRKKMNVDDLLHEKQKPIEIKKKNEGKFTDAAKAAGMGVQEYADKVLSDPDASPKLKKRANFAKNFGGK